ncbi:MAG: riboflavin synthase [Candidatus Uhrbacteria bacterium]|nr:riboflavin synthase [Patescibacteria group bacterium]MBU1906768.1 riboflavin synthase [Patescibacteria group bacterium]
MFTGIIKHQGIIDQFESSPEGAKIRIVSSALVGLIEIGSSVAVNGVCLTAIEIDTDGFTADVMPQTLKLTDLGDYTIGQSVNLETSLRAGDEIGGHFVYGHIDGVGEIASVIDEGDATLVTIQPSEHLMKYFVPQGSIAIDGVSLTLARVNSDTITVSLIAETLRQTNLSDRKVGDKVNLEVDMLAKYLEKIKSEG